MSNTQIFAGYISGDPFWYFYLTVIDPEIPEMVGNITLIPFKPTQASARWALVQFFGEHKTLSAKETVAIEGVLRELRLNTDIPDGNKHDIVALAKELEGAPMYARATPGEKLADALLNANSTQERNSVIQALLSTAL